MIVQPSCEIMLPLVFDNIGFCLYMGPTILDSSYVGQLLLNFVKYKKIVPIKFVDLTRRRSYVLINLY